MFESYNYIETLELLDMWPAEHAKKRFFLTNHASQMCMKGEEDASRIH